MDGRTELVLTPLELLDRLACPRCGEPMRIIAFILDPPAAQTAWLEIDQTGGKDSWD